MHMSNLTGKMSLVLVGGVALSLAILVPVTHLVLEETLLDLKEAHFHFVVDDVRNSIRNLSNIGLPLSALAHCQDIIDKRRGSDPEIGSIVVFGANGAILYSTDLGEIGSLVPRQWLVDGAADGKAIRSSDELVVMTAMSNAFGNYAGGVALRFATSNLVRQLEESWLLLGGMVVGELALASALALWGARLLFGPLSRGCQAGSAALEALVKGTAQPPASAMPGLLAGAYEGFSARAQGALATINRYVAQIARLDDLG